MALNKSKSNWALTVHVAAYTGVMLVGLILGGYWSTGLACFIVFNAAMHWITDYLTSRETSKLWFIEVYDTGKFQLDDRFSKTVSRKAYFVETDMEKRHDFFVMIGF